MKKIDLTRIFIDEIYSQPPKKNYETKKYSIIISMKSGFLTWQIFRIINHQITKHFDV